MEELIQQACSSLSLAERIDKEYLSQKEKLQFKEALITATSLTRAWISELPISERKAKGLKFIYHIASGYWDHSFQDQLKCPDFNAQLPKVRLDKTIIALANSILQSSTKVSVTEACYFIGNLYTIVLEDNVRTKNGAFYTPPNIVEQILKNVEDQGLPLLESKCLDPACGSGIFLVALCERIGKNSKQNGAALIRKIRSNFQGWEIDQNAAWLAKIFVECSLKEHQLLTSLRLGEIIQCCDSLSRLKNQTSKFDLIFGNPPYGKIKLDPEVRKIYERSLYGHANIYGLFMHLALQLVSTNGLICYITPTSFLAGEYFKALRDFYASETLPLSFDFISTRKGVFQDVLQETVISLFRKNQGKKIKVRVSEIEFVFENNDFATRLTKLGFISSKFSSLPWILPRCHEQKMFSDSLSYYEERLIDWGYEINTGQLVWNRHKSQLKDKMGTNCYPLIWAESILQNGKFQFNADKRNHSPYFEVSNRQEFLITRSECIVLQRTTSKEQMRRIQACMLPKGLAKKGVVIENHVNIIKPVKPKVSIQVLNKLLSSSIIDQIFRMISGSVAVSAYELGSIPLPSYEAINKIENKIIKAKTEKEINVMVKKLYGL